ncbi:MAG: hypothetical protein LLG05_14895, partial [Porphyromonadaceae bacterium]|nr:hypothetical protein [Porphyromonadaceae bacterium]
MAELNPVFLDNLTYPAKELRKNLKDIFTEGILSSTALAVSEHSTPAMSVDIALGRALIESDEGNYGTYVIENDALVTKTIASSDPSNPRIDRVIAQMYDATDIGGADNKWALEVLTGTPASSPVAPALPSNALDLALVAVGAGVTTILNANITDKREQATINGVDLSNYVDLSSAQTITGVKTFSSTPKMDAIAEKTADAGVTVDGLLIKDGKVAALSSKIITATRDMTSASGDVSYTGVGFMPTSIVCFGAISGTYSFFVGSADSSKKSSALAS